MMVGVGAAFAAASRAGFLVRVAAILVVLALGGNGVRVAIDEHIFGMWRGEQRFASAALQVRHLTRADAVIISLIHSGSVRYYGGRVSLRYDWLLGEWTDAAIPGSCSTALIRTSLWTSRRCPRSVAVLPGRR